MSNKKPSTLPNRALAQTPVQMNFSWQTLEAIDSLKELTGTTSRTHVVASAIRLTANIRGRLAESKGKLFIETPDGEKEYLVIT